MSRASRVLASLLEKNMDVPTAMKVLGIEASDLSDKEKVKKAYRAAAMLAHPDRGGDAEQMKLINQAWDVLSGEHGAVSHAVTSADRKAQRAEWEKKEKEMSVRVVHTLETTITPQAFIQHLQTIVGKEFTLKLNKGKAYSEHDINWNYEFSTEDKMTVFELSLSVSMSNIIAQPVMLGAPAGHLSFPVSLSTTIFHNNRKVKLSQRSWKLTSDHKVFIDPEELFPTKKLQKMVAGKESARKFAKRDMYLALNKRLGATYSGDHARIPMGKDEKVYLLMVRFAIMGAADWFIQGLFRGGASIGGVHVPHINTVRETEDTIEYLVNLQKSSKDLEGEQLIHHLGQELTKYKAAKAKGESLAREVLNLCDYLNGTTK